MPFKACRKTLLEELHLGHPGIVRMIMKALGRSYVVAKHR